MGRAIARLFARSGHAVVLGSRDPARARSAAASIAGAAGSSYAGAAAGSDVVALAAVWSDVPAVLDAAAPWEGRLLLDCTNPEPESGRGLLIGHVSSGGEEIARRAPGARVVKALNHIYAEALDAAAADSARPSAFYCGDDAAARKAVGGLLEGAGLRAIDAGPLRSARYLEPLAALMVELVRGQGLSPVEAAGLVVVRGREGGAVDAAP